MMISISQNAMRLAADSARKLSFYSSLSAAGKMAVRTALESLTRLSVKRSVPCFADRLRWNDGAARHSLESLLESLAKAVDAGRINLTGGIHARLDEFELDGRTCREIVLNDRAGQYLAHCAL